jgi:hypothetical protein
MDVVVERTCARCSRELGSTPVVTCAACLARHHEACWEARQVCVCGATRVLRAPRRDAFDLDARPKAVVEPSPLAGALVRVRRALKTAAVAVVALVAGLAGLGVVLLAAFVFAVVWLVAQLLRPLGLAPPTRNFHVSFRSFGR